MREPGRFSRSRLSVWRLGAISSPPTGPSFARTASTSTSTHIHDGHSLTDAYAATDVLDDLHQIITGTAPVYQRTHIKSTVPGSPTSMRWPYYSAPGTPIINPRHDAGLFDTLMLTERGLPDYSIAAPSTAPVSFLEDLLFELRFISNAVVNGRGDDCILWGIWPGTDMSEPWNVLIEQEEYRHRLRSEWLTWKVKQLHPSLPADWRVWFCPGYELLRRLVADVGGTWPGPETGYADFLYDAIHPAPKLQVGLGVLVATMLYQVDLRTLTPAVYAFSDRCTNAEMDYFMATAWNIASTYEPCGMGGAVGADPVWTLTRNGDYFPSITTLAELGSAVTEDGQILAVWNGRDGAVPADALIAISADGVVLESGLAFDTALPAPTGRYIEIASGNLHTVTGMNFPNGVWQAALVQIVNPPNNVYAYAGGVMGGWDGWAYDLPNATIAPWTAGGNGNLLCTLSTAGAIPNGNSLGTNKIVFLDPRLYEAMSASNIPVGFWIDLTNRGVLHPDGTTVSDAHETTYPLSGNNRLQRFRVGPGADGNPLTGTSVRIWGWIVMDREPTPTEWADMFDWLSAKALKP